MIPSFLYRKDGKLNASSLRPSFFKEHYIDIYNSIENEIKPLYKDSNREIKYTEYIYSYFAKNKTNYLCQNPNCNNLSKFINLQEGYKDFCCKSCYWEKYNLEQNEIINKKKKEINKEKDQYIKNRVFLEKLDYDFFNKNGSLNANTTREKWIKENKIELYNIINKLNLTIPFEEKLYLYLYNFKNIPKCITCNKKLIYKGTLQKGYGKYCDNNCSVKNKEAHKLGMQKYRDKLENKYGKGIRNFFQTNEFKEKSKDTSMKKYNTEFPSQSEEFKGKAKQTIIERYGSKKALGKITYKKSIKTLIIKYPNVTIKSYMDVPGAKEKQKKTNIKKYNAPYILCGGTIIREKIEKHNLQLYNTISSFGRKDVKIKSKRTIFNKIKSRINKNLKYDISFKDFLKKGIYGEYIFICNKCGNKFIDTLVNNTYKTIMCKKCRPRNISIYEQDIKDFIIKNTFLELQEVQLNNRTILKGKELDIYIPKQNLAIEYNGLMWHSIGKSRHIMFNNAELESEIKKKHLWKTMECKKLGIQLLHIFENEWLNPIKQNIWKNIIKNKIGVNNNRIYGRNTTIKLVSNEASKNFLNMYHLQGNVSSKLKIGLFDKKSNELLSIMIFGKSRFDKNVEWELLRFATKNGINVIGGASKIFSYFKNTYLENGQLIKTYADLRFSNGDVYNKLGFEQIGQSKPNYFYFKSGSLELESRQKYQKHKLRGKLDNFDKDLTESENMYNNDYRKIYDCGNLVFIYKRGEED